MLDSLLGHNNFNQLMKKHANEVVSFLLKEGINFSILTNIADVEFDPILPAEISQNFKPITMFFLAGYTFESTQLGIETMSFEAGFGSENFGSIVNVPMHAILQIIVEEIPVFINLSTPPKIEEKKPTQEGVKRSMNALMANPENQKLLKR